MLLANPDARIFPVRPVRITKMGTIPNRAKLYYHPFINPAVRPHKSIPAV